jgi:hypothetical protein
MAVGLRTTPFTYYYNILHDMLRSDKSYDSLPNFTAADCALSVCVRACVCVCVCVCVSE